MTKKELLIDINGYLEGIAILNTFVNDQKTYNVDLLAKIDNDIQTTLQNFFEVKQWTIELIEPKADWQSIFTTELRPYFNQIIKVVGNYMSKGSICSDNTLSSRYFEELVDANNNNANINEIIKTFLKKIEQLLADTPFEFKKVHVNRDWKDGFYECAYNDYLFDLGDEILFVHFGLSD